MLADDYFTIGGSNPHAEKGSRVSLLPRSVNYYSIVEDKFKQGWKHPDKPVPPIHGIFTVMTSPDMMSSYKRYRTKVGSTMVHRKTDFFANEQLLFHGTNRCCLLGEDTRSNRLCELPECNLCRIIKGSFDVGKCGSKNKFRRFGTGIYTTTCSSKADDYVLNRTKSSYLRVMLVSRVVVGKPHELRLNSTELTEPPLGYHSVIGKPGPQLNYPETVVYDNDAIRPVFLVVYGFPPEGETSSGVKSAISKLFKTPLVS